MPTTSPAAGMVIAALVVLLAFLLRLARRRVIDVTTHMTGELQALTESADEAIVSIDDSGTIVAWNRSAETIFGASATEMVGQPASRLVPPGTDGDQLARILSSVDSEEIPRHTGPTLAIARRADGTDVPVEVSLSQWSARGRRFLTGFVRDVTDRIEAERTLAETGSLLRSVLDAATGIAVIGTEVDGTISFVNSGAEHMLGYRIDDLVGHASPLVFHDAREIADRARKLGILPGFDVLATIPRRDRSETRTWTYVRADGTRFPVELTVTPRADRDGAPSGFIGVAVDVTERLAAIARQQDLLDQERDMVAKLTDLDRAKNDFVSSISHELRTPLTSIIGYAELLADDGASEMTERHLAMVDIVARNAQRLLLLVEDLLTVSRIDTGEIDIEMEPCDVARLLAALRASVEPIAHERDITVDYAVDHGSVVLADPAHLERVFMNLVSNAIKFSERGNSVEVVIRRAHDDVEIHVIDHGIGIAADELDHLFERFFRSRTAERHAIQGTGLGLTIVSDIVRQHNGRVDVHSVEGEGTTMIVRLPAHHPTPSPGPATADARA